ncbi:hypothetical protein UFOVP54_70 [uncultured Caudovirales phage]|uniref:DUF7936 domain-containing protein n=1 Tax=uncultured Caudovirales phage TaxID=2100421 RepID=A0A6J5KUZ4_9CAUD|nr:hypothetical protein UFOVP54_70 [uncultured Caudovirales phage]
MTTTWKIIDLKSQIADGLVTNVTYECRVELEGIIARKIEEMALAGDPTKPNYIPFAELLEEDILRWITASLGQAQMTRIETELQDTVTARKVEKDAITEKSGIPWI